MSFERVRAVLGGVMLGFIGVGVGATLSGASCADLERGERAAGGGADGGAEAGPPGDGGGGLTFAQDVHPLLLGGCGDCHAAGGQASDTGLVFTGDPDADRAATLAFVNADAPAQSRLLNKASGNGHEGGAIYTADSTEYQTILGWIMQGTSP
jgi:hypothetical protein